jgi:hypothetical protein
MAEFKTIAEQIKDVQAAIAKVETGCQARGVAGRSITRANYADLVARERQLLIVLKRQKQGQSYRYFVHE